MEGSAAGGTAGSGGDAGSAQGGDAGGSQDASHDFARFADTIGEMAPGQEEAWRALNDQQHADMGEAQPLGDPDAFAPEDADDFDADQDPRFDTDAMRVLTAAHDLDDAEAAHLAPYMSAWVQQEVQERVQQATAPIAQQLRDTHFRHEAEALEREFPRLRDPKAAEQLVAISTEYARQIGRPELGTDPGFMRHVLERAEHAELAAKRAAASAEQQDPGDRIVHADASQGAAALPFRSGQ